MTGHVVSLSRRRALLAAAENFTVLIKNSITYPKFNIHRSVSLNVKKTCVERCRLLSVRYMQTCCFIVCHDIRRMSSSLRRNILPHINSSYLKRCEFNRTTDPHCPIFRLKHIVSEAGEEFQEMAVKVCPIQNKTCFLKCLLLYNLVPPHFYYLSFLISLKFHLSGLSQVITVSYLSTLTCS